MQFTKTLAATAALLTVAGAAAAADVTLYGIVDEGLLYKHTRTNGVSSNSFSMESGLFAPSRWGMKGNEELGNGLKVGFKLESGFSSDTGALANEGKRLFHRESALTVSGGFGTLAAGRMGGVGSNSGTYDIVYAMSEVSDGSWANVSGMFMSDRYDNMLTYQSPKFAGLQATVQYSFKGNDADDKNAEGTSKVDRYYSGALSYENGGLQAVVAYEYFNRGNDKEQDVDSRSIRRNAQIVSLGGSYDFGVAKVFGLAQYADGVDRFGFFNQNNLRDAFGIEKTTLMNYDGFKGWAAHLGASAPLCGGTILGGVYYADAESQKATVEHVAKDDVDAKFVGVNLQYNYPLSKRTHVYVGASYGQTKFKGTASITAQKTEVSQGYVGMAHFF
jgi:predicted porin